MIEIIILLLIFILVGSHIYYYRFLGKDKPKVGTKRDDFSGYLKDYGELKLYWGSIALMVIGVVVLIAIVILELVF